MKHWKLSITLLLIAFLSTVNGLGATRASVEALLHSNQGRPFLSRLDSLSEHFVGSRYVLGPLGEGAGGDYDQDPLYRFDVFDCTTFVETAMALAFSRNFLEFERKIDLIRYNDRVIGYTTRNHFPEVDWIANNTRISVLHDVTAWVAGGRESFAETVIDKPAWYAKMGLSAIEIPNLSDEERRERLARLRREGERFEAEPVANPYIHFETVFGDGGDLTILDRIPNGAVINIVRPNWEMAEKIGTNLNISHQGFALRHGGVLYFRHASKDEGKVVTVPLEGYLRRFLTSKTIKGINVLELTP